ncbi:hypothetical protein PHISP_07245 [Aspergillus sp. HF37]|nr:hypothetical protein PHISP_07245 [Aspergillus sp. HF37]
MPSDQYVAGSDWRYDDVWYRGANERSAGDFPVGARRRKPVSSIVGISKEPPSLVAFSEP